MKPSKKTPYMIRLIPTLPIGIESHPFKLSQLRASKNNVRPNYWVQTLRENERLRKVSVNGKEKKSRKLHDDASNPYSSSQLDVSSLQPTTCYNMAVLEDVAAVAMSETIASAISACPCIRPAILLMKVRMFQYIIYNF